METKSLEMFFVVLVAAILAGIVYSLIEPSIT